MFKSFSDSSRNQEFHGFPNLNFQMNNERYGYSGFYFDLDARFGKNKTNDVADLGAISSWVDTLMGVEYLQGTAGNQPRLQLTDVNFNNYPSIDFHTNARILTSNTGLSLSNEHTLILVGKVNTINSNSNFVFTNGGDATATHLSVLTFGGDSSNYVGIGIYRGNANNQAAVMTSTIEDTSPHIVVITPYEIVIDGVQRATGLWQPNQIFSAIGLTTGAIARNFLGRLTRVLAREGSLSSQDCINISTNINTEYAIY